MGERKPVAFGDLRGWIAALDAAGELQRINAEVDWNIELGTIARLAQGAGTGPALLFGNIRDYGANARCRQVFTGGLSSARRVAMMLGLSPDTHPRELVRLSRTVQMDLRAATTHPATLDLLDDALVADMARVGLVAPIFQFWDRPSEELVAQAQFDHAVLKNDTRHPFVVQCEQFKTAQLVLDRLQHYPNVE